MLNADVWNCRPSISLSPSPKVLSAVWPPPPWGGPPPGRPPGSPLGVSPPRKTKLVYNGTRCLVSPSQLPFPTAHFLIGLPYFQSFSFRRLRPFLIPASLSLPQDPVSLIFPFECSFLSILAIIIFIQPPIDEFC